MEQLDWIVFLRRIEEFYLAGARLSDTWDELQTKYHDHLQGLGIEGYPKCLPSFDEFVTMLLEWHEEQSKIYNEILLKK
jgi:hypothetical protein